MNGLTLTKKEFERLPMNQKLTLLYENTEELKSMVGGYKFQQKIQYAWLSLLTIAIIGRDYLLNLF